MEQVADGKLVGALLLDLSKAFDSINHEQLLQELENIGCSHMAISWFSSFLKDRLQRVKIIDRVSSWRQVEKGVPQGSPLSPLLFNIMVRLLPQASQTEAFQFADDLTNSDSDRDLGELSSKLQAMYSRVKAFCNDRNLTTETASC